MNFPVELATSLFVNLLLGGVCFFLFSALEKKDEFIEKLLSNHRAELKEKDEHIKDLEVKFMSKDVDEYLRGKLDPNQERSDRNSEEDNQFVPVEDVPVDKLLEAEDRL